MFDLVDTALNTLLDIAWRRRMRRLAVCVRTWPPAGSPDLLKKWIADDRRLNRGRSGTVVLAAWYRASARPTGHRENPI